MQYKIVLLGDSGVGKSSLVLRYCKGLYSPSQEPTIGAAFLTHDVPLQVGSFRRLQIWDTAGQERFHSLAPMYYRGSKGAIVVFDVLNMSSFDKAKEWVDELRTQGSPNTIIILAGNKIDLEEERRVPQELINDYCKENDLVLFETSAKTGENVDRMFEDLAEMLPSETGHTMFGDFGREGDGPIDLGVNQPIQKNTICC